MTRQTRHGKEIVALIVTIALSAVLFTFSAEAEVLVDFLALDSVTVEPESAAYRPDATERQIERTSQGLVVRTSSHFERSRSKWLLLTLPSTAGTVGDWSDCLFRVVLAAPPVGRFTSAVAVNLVDCDGEVFQQMRLAESYTERGEFALTFDARKLPRGKKGWGTPKANGIPEPPLRLGSLAFHYNSGIDELGTIGAGSATLLRIESLTRPAEPVAVRRSVTSREAISTNVMYPGARPFPGADELEFLLVPAFSGTAKLTLSHGSKSSAEKGVKDTFETVATNGVARFDVGLPYETAYQFLSVICQSKDGQAEEDVRVVSAEGTFVQTAAEALRLRVETGNPLHIIRDGQGEWPRLVVWNPADRSIAWTGSIALTDYFGREVRLPFNQTLEPGQEKEVEMPWPLPSRGLWRVRAEVRGDDGSETVKEDRFAWVDFHTVTPKAEKPKFRMGIHYHGTKYFPEKIDLTIAGLVAAGAKITRCDYDHMWADIEHREGVERWEKSDFMINKLAAAGLALDIIFAGTPEWAATPESLEKNRRDREAGYRVKNNCRVPRPGLFRRFCEKFARRYGTAIDYYECGNEWDMTGTGTAEYANLLRMQQEAYNGLHAGCPDACVTPCGWTTAVSCSNGNLKVWQNGLVEYFAEHPEVYDAWALHCHGTPESFMVNISQRFLPMREAKPLRNRPWLLNETALSCVNGQEDAVASAVWQKIVYGWAAGAQDYIWYNLRATGWFEGSEPGYGLLTADYRPRAGYAAFATLSTLLQGMDFDASLHSRGLRHLFRFKGRSKAVADGIVLVGWDTSHAESRCRAVFATDAAKATSVDLMGNRRDVPIADGHVTFAFGFRPEALVLEGARRAELENGDELARRNATAIVVRQATNCPQVALDTAENVKDLYEANADMVHRLWKGADDHSARLWFAPTDGGFILRARVCDDVRAPGDGIDMVVHADGSTQELHLTPKSRDGMTDAYEAAVPTADNEVGIELKIHDDDGCGEDSYLFLTREGSDPLLLRLERD